MSSAPKEAGSDALLPVTQADEYIERRLIEGGLRLVSGSPTMLQDEFARFEADRAALSEVSAS